MSGNLRNIRIPPPGCKLTLLCSPPGQVVRAMKPAPSSHLSLPCPKETEVKAQEEPREGKEKEEHHIENKGQDGGHRGPHSSGDVTLTPSPLETNRVLTSRKCSPGPPDLHPKHPEDSVSENTQMSPISSSWESHVITISHSPAGDVLPPWKPDPYAMVLSDPTSCCSLLPKRSTKEVPGEDPLPSSPGSLMSGKMWDESLQTAHQGALLPRDLPAVGPANRESSCHLCSPCHCHCHCCGAQVSHSHLLSFLAQLLPKTRAPCKRTVSVSRTRSWSIKQGAWQTTGPLGLPLPSPHLHPSELPRRLQTPCPSTLTLHRSLLLPLTQLTCLPDPGSCLSLQLPRPQILIRKQDAQS